MDELGYIPNSVARSLKKRTTSIIGILVPDIKNPFFPSIVGSISEALLNDGYEIFAASSKESPDKQAKILEAFLQFRVSAIVAIPTGAPEVAYDQFARVIRHIPIILLDRDVPGLKCPKVLLDNHSGAKKLTLHLIKMGHKRIGIITPPLFLSIGKERLSGYKQALVENDLEVLKELIFEGDLFQRSGQKALDYFLQLDKNKRPTAILSCSDMMTLGFLKRAQERGVKIPEDFSFVSFDDPEYFELLTPPLTCLAQPVKLFGEKVSELLVKILSSTHINFETTDKLMGELKTRGSVKPLL